MQSQVVLLTQELAQRGKKTLQALIVGAGLTLAAFAAQADTAANGAVDITPLMTQARLAMDAGHVMSPAGQNAFELYLRAGEAKPSDVRPREALRDLYPMATAAADGALKRGNISEARRLLELLDRAMPGTYSVTSLRARVERAEPALTQR